MKTFPLYQNKELGPIQHDRIRNVLNLSARDKRSLLLYLNNAGIRITLRAVDIWLSRSPSASRAPLRTALRVAEWAQLRKGHNPVAVIVALAKLDKAPAFEPHPPNKEAIAEALESCRGLALDDDEDFAQLIGTVATLLEDAQLASYRTH